MEPLVNLLATIIGGYGVHMIANPTISKIGGEDSALPEIIGPVVGVLTTLPFIILIDRKRQNADHFGWIESYLSAYFMFGIGVLLAYYQQALSREVR